MSCLSALPRVPLGSVSVAGKPEKGASTSARTQGSPRPSRYDQPEMSFSEYIVSPLSGLSYSSSVDPRRSDDSLLAIPAQQLHTRHMCQIFPLPRPTDPRIS